MKLADADEAIEDRFAFFVGDDEFVVSALFARSAPRYLEACG